MHSGRVLGVLAVSKSFGDHAFKQFVTADPYLSYKILRPTTQNPFFMVCCDGIWDVLSDDEAILLVLKSIKDGQESRAAEMIVLESLSRGSTDNLSAIVVFL